MRRTIVVTRSRPPDPILESRWAFWILSSFQSLAGAKSSLEHPKVHETNARHSRQHANLDRSCEMSHNWLASPLAFLPPFQLLYLLAAAWLGRMTSCPRPWLPPEEFPPAICTHGFICFPATVVLADFAVLRYTYGPLASGSDNNGTTMCEAETSFLLSPEMPKQDLLTCCGDVSVAIRSLEKYFARSHHKHYLRLESKPKPHVDRL